MEVSVFSLSGLDKEAASKALTLCFAQETVKIVASHVNRVNEIITDIQQYVDGHIKESVERCNL
jgi:hypothetical protein